MGKPLLITEDEFRAAAKGDAVLADTRLRKGFALEVKDPGDGTRTLDFVISTASVDRMGDTIAVDGWDLANFRKNPVVLWAHDSGQMPVAKASNIRIEDDALKATAEFMPDDIDVSGFSRAVYLALKGGFLSATSVGFAPTKYAFSQENDRPWGIDFLEQELLEFSIVPVPANQDCLVQARAAGIDIEPIRAWAEKAMAADGVAVLPRKQLDAILALPARFRALAEKLPEKAKGARGQILRCANIAERQIQAEEVAADDEDPSGRDEIPPAEPGTPRLAMAKRRLLLMDRRQHA